MLRFLTFFLLFFPLLCFAQSIDEITTNQQALEFIKKNHPPGNDPDYTYAFHPFKPLLSSLSKIETDSLFPPFQFFEKADFDNNGHTDLLLNGYYAFRESDYSKRISMVVFAFGNDSFRSQILSLSRYDAFFSASLLKKEKQNLISIHFASSYDNITSVNNSLLTGRDTLIAFQSKMIERRLPSNHQIHKIRYSSYGRNWITNTYEKEFIIQPNNSLFKQDIWSKDGTHFVYEHSKSKTPPEFWGRLCELLNHLDITRLKEKYEPIAYDDLQISLEIEYDNGKIKKIDDDVHSATFGLETIEEMIENYFTSQPWKKFKRTKM